MDMKSRGSAPSQRWFQGIPRYSWVVLLICSLGWLFDCMDQNMFNLVRSNSVKQLLSPYISSPALLDASVKQVGGYLTATFLFGWAAGGFLFGVIGDRIGRVRTMIYTILIYAVFTGMNALVRTPWEYGLCRFLTALGVGGEFAAGTALVAEVWPDRSRAMALGTLQALSAVGNILAAFIALLLSAYSWRWIYVIGAVPAALVAWIQTTVHEPEKWTAVRDQLAKQGSCELGNMSLLFIRPEIRRNTLAGMFLAIAGVGGFWGVAVWLPDLVGSAFRPFVEHSAHILALAPDLRKSAINATLQAYKSKAFLMQMTGGLLGMFGYAALSQKMGRKPSLLIFLIAAFVTVQGAFRFVHNPLTAYLWAFPLGFCVMAPFSAFSVYFPELFPTSLRSTGIGFCYNCARVLAAFAAISLGDLASRFSVPGDESAGLRKAAILVSCIYVVGLIGIIMGPETKGKPLPD